LASSLFLFNGLLAEGTQEAMRLKGERKTIPPILSLLSGNRSLHLAAFAARRRFVN